MQEWHCYVCGDLIGQSETVLTLCTKESCARAMGVVKVFWEPKEPVRNVAGNSEILGEV